MNFKIDFEEHKKSDYCMFAIAFIYLGSLIMCFYKVPIVISVGYLLSVLFFIKAGRHHFKKGN